MSRFICSLKDLAPKPKKFLCNNKLRTDRLVRPPGPDLREPAFYGHGRSVGISCIK